MANFEVVLFDADNTLFDFDRAEDAALRGVLAARGYPTDGETLGRYLSINRALWARLDRGEVTQSWLVVERFAAFARAMGREDDPVSFNRDYLDRLAQGAFLLPGAEELCRALAPHCTLALITNGVARAQRGRLARSPLGTVIPHLFISEEVGAAKPSPAFFEPVLRQLGNPRRERVLVVGDNLATDIRGGLEAGLPTAWYNPGHLPNTTPWTPRWEVASYAGLAALILEAPTSQIEIKEK
ncbi:YjjG family noncanonical pyrimidine nucleotidase [uncultured Flavonifractor sp.]|uniref:YjjG family noncanonical pyrimidine nucleotidase n=1 Tax=uncultured Flavonifractor sp. TaxID=1193534 RepID=UPI0026372A20|nr:YjjG family noncanonical pyrimidine nucleotidase [uncultured Flavonifractor sp.]